MTKSKPEDAPKDVVWELTVKGQTKYRCIATSDPVLGPFRLEAFMPEYGFWTYCGVRGIVAMNILEYLATEVLKEAS